MNDNTWLLLILSLPGSQGALRIRTWRALKSLGAAVLRDGVYLLPASPERSDALEQQAASVRSAGGSAHVIAFESSDQEARDLEGLFDRESEYASLIAEVREFHETVAQAEEGEARRRLAQLQRQFQVISQIDFFSGPAREQTAAAMAEAEAAYNARFAPDEPTSTQRDIIRRRASDYCGRCWATRAHLWIDRAASAWLVSRFIDPDAEFVWLQDANDCPSEAVGFDFDGAEFTHVDNRVTFEVLLDSFDLADDPALRRIAALVHYMDVGGIPVPEAAGLVTVLTGARLRLPDDDSFLSHASTLLNDLYRGHRADAPQ